jgi:hypothetical protein
LIRAGREYGAFNLNTDKIAKNGLIYSNFGFVSTFPGGLVFDNRSNMSSVCPQEFGRAWLGDMRASDLTAAGEPLAWVS